MQGPKIAMGERLGLEAAHAVADHNPLVVSQERLNFGSVTPISLYRTVIEGDQPHQAVGFERKIVETAPTRGRRRRTTCAPNWQNARPMSSSASRPVRGAPSPIHSCTTSTGSSGRSNWPSVRALPTEVDGEIWAARLGDCAIVGTPGEIFGEIGAAVREASPAQTTIFAGYCHGVLGYIATPEEYPYGGYEPAVSHRGYGLPAPFTPEVAGIIRDTSLELLRQLF